MHLTEQNLRTRFMLPAIQGYFRSTAHGWVGPDAVVAGLKAIERGDCREVTFVVATNPNAVGADKDRLVRVFTVGREVINDDLCWRYNPGRAGSSAICASGTDQSIETAAARVVYALASCGGQEGWIWRQPDPNHEGVA